MLARFREYLASFFTRLGYLMGLVMYGSYAAPSGEWGNIHLIVVSIVTGFFLPTFVWLSDVFEHALIRRFGSIFFGKSARFAWQSAFNGWALFMLLRGGVLHAAALKPVGGALGAVALMSFASQGVQYLMIELVNRNIGNRYLNITLGLSLNICISALAALGFVPIQIFFVFAGLILGFIGAGYSLISDLMGVFAPRGGIGVFFGTFNPVHTSHIKILKRFIESRDLEKVYLHPTIVPSFYQGLLDEGVIEIECIRNGMRVYRKTGRGDMHMDYFPTGNTFYEVENRLAMLQAAVEDADLADRVEVLYLPRTYRARGFRGVIGYVRALHPELRLHGLHGSDEHGSIVRMIYDSALVIPFAAVRRDSVSATAIRSGRAGLTSPTVEAMICALRDDQPKRDGDVMTFGNHRFIYREGRLYPAANGTWFGNAKVDDRTEPPHAVSLTTSHVPQHDPVARFVRQPNVLR